MPQATTINMNDRVRFLADRSLLATAVLSGITGLAGSFAVAGSTARFVGAPINSAIVDVMPARVVTFSILVLGKLGETLGYLLGLGVVIALLGGVTLLALSVVDSPNRSALLTFGLGWIVAAALTAAPVFALGPAVPMGIAVAAREHSRQPGPGVESRRDLLKSIGGVVVFSGIAYLFGDRVSTPTAPDTDVAAVVGGTDNDQPVQEAIQQRLAEAERKSLNIDGIPGLVSGFDEFYEVDIALIDPNVNADDWRLSVTGAVENEFTLEYKDFTAMDIEHRFVSLRCVSDPLNGDLMDNALWTGVPVRSLLERANPQGSQVVLRAADDYYMDFPIEAFEDGDGFLAFGMNGTVLPRVHGYPVRAHVQGHWGEINVKWLTEIQVVEDEVLSYWEQRGWHGTGPVHTVAKLHAVNTLADGRMQVAGHAYAGTRGIEAVEVSIDGGGTWAKARLSNPLPDKDVWRQWAYEWTPQQDSYPVVVRAIDGTGTVQPEERTDPDPSGATGWVSKRVTT